MQDLIRLSKLMSERGLCSRREADSFIKAGAVTVNGEVISTLGTKVSPDAEIHLNASAQQNQNEKVTLILNKPLGYVSTQPEDGKKHALDLITEERCVGEYRPFKRIKMGVGGRLDIDSKGLLVFSQNGTVIKQLIGPNTDIEKEYLVRVSGQITDDKINRLRFGLKLDDKKLKKAQVDQLEPHLLRFVLKEGKKRQIRRMCGLVNLEVEELIRVRVGNVRLGRLPVGHWRFIKEGESF